MARFYWDYNGDCVVTEEQLQRDHESLVASGDYDADFGHYLFEAICKSCCLKYLGQFNTKDEVKMERPNNGRNYY